MHKIKDFLTNLAVYGAWAPAVDMWQHAYARRHDWRMWAQLTVISVIFSAVPRGVEAQYFGWPTAVQILLISLLVMLPLVAYQSKPSPWAMVAIVMYTLSYAVANLYHIAFDLIAPWSPEIRALMADIPGSARGFALRLYQFGTLLILAIYAILNFFALWDKDLQTRMNWLVLAIAESFAVLEYAECRVFTDPFGSQDLYLAGVWGVEVVTSACGQKFGPGTDYAAPIITTIFMIFVNWNRRK